MLRRENFPSSADAALLQGLRVLVVDDDAVMRDGIAVVLEHYGGQVTAVASVVEAMAAIKRERPEVILSDLRMPVDDGYGLIRKVRALSPERGRPIPTAALSASDGVDEQRRAIRAGFYLLVSKSVSPGRLVDAVAALAGRALSRQQQQAA
jgi:CheY-like chemotaxis protein